MSTKKDLISRWRSTRANDVASERIFNICKHGGALSIDNSPFGRLIGGRIDFRGYPAHRILVRDVNLKDIDLTYADFSSARLEANRFERCLLAETDFTDVSDHGDLFDHCVFLNCKFNLAVLGYEGTLFRNCVFKECSFQKTSFIRPEFVRTDFIECKLKGIDFNASSFENCRFEGVLEDVWFRGTFPLESDIAQFGRPKINNMEHVSFENADLFDLTFSDGCDLSTVKLKRNGKYVKYDRWPERLRFLEKEMGKWEGHSLKKEAARFLEVRTTHAQKQDWEILNLDDLEKYYGGKDAAQKIASLLNGFATNKTQ